MPDSLHMVPESLFTSVNVIAALLGTIGAVIVGILSSFLTYRYTRKVRLEAEWRIDKLYQYRELMSALSGIVNSIDKEDHDNAVREYAKATNMVSLVASQKVIGLLAELPIALNRLKADKTAEADRKAKDKIRILILELRKDLKITPEDDPNTFSFTLLRASPKSESTKPESSKPD